VANEFGVEIVEQPPQRIPFISAEEVMALAF